MAGHWSIAAALITLTLSCLSMPTAAQPLTAELLRTRLDTYLTGYEPKLSALIADELMVQRNVHGRRPTGGIGPPEYRTIRSEVAFVSLPGNAGWLGFRHVRKVSRTPIDDARSLAIALSTSSTDDYARARQMLADSARYNLGAPRTINLPNLPLELLHRRHAGRFVMHLDGHQDVRGTDTVRLVLTEVAAPTVIQAYDGGDMRTTVTAFIEASTGTLWRADVAIQDPARDPRLAFEHIISVEFRNEKKLGLLVPISMHEQFWAGDNRDAWSDADYRNFRQFQTSARIIQQ